MHVTEHVQETIFNRLTRPTPEDGPVLQPCYWELVSEVEGLIFTIAGDWTIRGFTEEDLRSLCYLKVHHDLRRGWFDLGRNPRPYFRQAFVNLFRDINRMTQVATKNGMEQDMMEYAETWSFGEELGQVRYVSALHVYQEELEVEF